jgi:hypothetical protein
MSTTKRLLVLAIAVAMLMGLTMTATTAADCPFPGHPKCPDPPDTTTTTTAPEPPPSGEACAPDEGVITLVPGPGFTSFECLWTPENDGSTTGTVTVEATAGSISGPVVFVRDASPGDICLLQQEWDGPPFSASFDLAYGDLPDDDLWDPDDLYPDFAPYENQTYWTFGGTHWCYPQDAPLGMRDDPNGEPLHMLVNFRAKKNTTVEITLTPTQTP